MADPIKAVCHRDFYPATRWSSNRALKEIRFVVMHDTEGGTASSNARYFHGEEPGGSAHLVVDDFECQRCLPNSAVPWGAPGANFRGFHIEQCGFASWSRETWLTHDKMLRRAAYKTAFHCKLFNIPVVFITAADLRAGKKGITTHAECTKAFGGSHTDPGHGWPRDKFMAYVRMYFKEL